MAIIQISRITHRTGLKEDLPQLAKAELGWAIDSRELYIGNGLPEQGAPIAGNTRILTEYSDLFALLESYTFKGLAAGYQVTTGIDAVNPIIRTLQDKLDDSVNVRDFGAKGTGTTDDTDAFKRAIAQIYDQIELTLQPLVRREIKVPAGTYNISSDVLILPPWACIKGDGKDKTIIKQLNVLQDCLIKTGDSLLQTENNIGTNLAVAPSEITVSDLTLMNESTKPVLIVDSAHNVTFNNVSFVGNQDLPSTGVANSSNIVIDSSAGKSSNIRFISCDIANASYGVVSDSDASDVHFDNCYFSGLYVGFKLGENSTTEFPKNWSVTNSVFEDNHHESVKTFAGVTGICSVGNKFTNVGCSYDGVGSEISSVLLFADNGCTSISDIFDRTEANETTYKAVSYGTNQTVVINSERGLLLGTHADAIGRSITLLDNIVFPDVSGITVSSTVNAVEIDYTMRRLDITRRGTLTITRNATSSFITDEYMETSNIGVEFSVAHSSGSTALLYKTTSTGANVTFKYQIKKFV